MTVNNLHIAVSFIIVWYFYKFGFRLTTSIMIASLVGVLKETYDYWSYGLFSLKDIGYDLIGIGLAVLFLCLLTTCSSTVPNKKLSIKDPFFHEKLHHSVMKEKM